MLSQTEFIILKKLSQLNLLRNSNIVYDDITRVIAVGLIVKFLVSTTRMKSHTVRASLNNLYEAGCINSSCSPTSKGLATLDGYFKERLANNVIKFLPLVITITNLAVTIVKRAS